MIAHARIRPHRAVQPRYSARVRRPETADGTGHEDVPAGTIAKTSMAMTAVCSSCSRTAMVPKTRSACSTCSLRRTSSTCSPCERAASSRWIRRRVGFGRRSSWTARRGRASQMINGLPPMRRVRLPRANRLDRAAPAPLVSQRTLIRASPCGARGSCQFSSGTSRARSHHRGHRSRPVHLHPIADLGSAAQDGDQHRLVVGEYWWSSLSRT